MKTLTSIIISALFMLIVFSCNEGCEDEMKYKTMQKEVAGLQEQIETLQLQIGQLDIENDTAEYLELQEQIIDLYVMQAFLEIEMELLKNESRCF